MAVESMAVPPVARRSPAVRTLAGGRSRSGSVVVVGGGIAGLAAAHAIAVEGGPSVSVTLLEAGPEVGGKLRVSPVAGVPVDEGAEAVQATRPEAVALARAVGLESELVYPVGGATGMWTRGRVRAMPPSVMGVPTDLRALASSGVLPLRAVLALPLEAARPATAFDADVSVGAFVEARLGRELVDTLVEPLLDGVFAGRADALSLRATVPSLFREVRSERSLLKAAARVSRGGGRESGARRGPVFAGLRGGVGRLPQAVAADLVSLGARVRTGSAVRSLHRTDAGWRVVVGPVAAQEVLRADAVVLAVPAPQVASLISHLVPGSASDFGLIKHASTAVTTLAYRRSDVLGPLTGGGFLVPAREGRTIKSAGFSTNKWEWLNIVARSRHQDGLVLIRAAVGRLGEDAVLDREDAEIVALCHDDLAEAIGLAGPPVASRVVRWRNSIPQYAVGHVARVERIRSRVAEVPGLALCGATYDGVGVAAVVGSARTAAGSVLRHLDQRAQSMHG